MQRNISNEDARESKNGSSTSESLITSWGSFRFAIRLSQVTPRYDVSDDDGEDMFSVYAWSSSATDTEQFSRERSHFNATERENRRSITGRMDEVVALVSQAERVVLSDDRSDEDGGSTRRPSRRRGHHHRSSHRHRSRSSDGSSIASDRHRHRSSSRDSDDVSTSVDGEAVASSRHRDHHHSSHHHRSKSTDGSSLGSDRHRHRSSSRDSDQLSTGHPHLDRGHHKRQHSSEPMPMDEPNTPSINVPGVDQQLISKVDNGMISYCQAIKTYD